MTRILLLEDDPALGRSLQLSLELEAFEVAWATTVAAAEELWANGAFDLCLLDWNLPDGTGIDFMREMRRDESANPTPVIFLTARQDEESAISALTKGAQDFVRKPFNRGELFARIGAALRLHHPPEEILRFGPLSIARATRKVLCEDTPIELNRREFDILCHLVRRAEAIVSREELLRLIDREGEVFDRTIDSHVSHIRTRLKKAGVRQVQLNSVYGVGYRLEKAPPA